MSEQAEKRFTLELTIQSDESLGLFDTSRLQDYNGVDGHLTLYHHDTGQEFDIVMAEISGGGPYQHDIFQGIRDASTMPLGKYDVMGRVKDLEEHYVILTGFQNPLGIEVVVPLSFQLVEGKVSVKVVFVVMQSPQVIFDMP